MKLIKTEDAVGHVLCHDMTQIIPGEFKGAKFRKGHIVTEEDVPVLLSMGKRNIYIWEKNENMLHEDEAAKILYKICAGDNCQVKGEIKEGKITVAASCDGLLKIDKDALNRVNALGEMMIATRHGDFPVKKGQELAATRIIPLIIEKEKMDKAIEVAGDTPILEVLPFKKKKAGIVTTGSEVYTGKIKDAFGPVIRQKFAEYDIEVLGQTITDDSAEMTTNAIKAFLDQGADMIVCTGGMSVDPDDLTPTAIKATGAKIVSYGAPVLPGAMFLISYLGDIPIMGLPGCVMYSKRTIFDLVLPRVMANDPITVETLSKYGEGGLCLSCDNCTFPNCGFGKC
ncbi:molybdenum cofactor synthesis domain-containing protein [Acetitomaculum ruminis DSM 5522]|uniref:Molybdopterin molybdenumtransferase n=1 Tax=Acetitomaculum ruminis DSM 5522 TaxID=1120918 RepID=A0A1I0UYX9_9FIRM|nr:molybdopterin-binding protein [Acetitomaculum ruminis]SFA69083.1 molybdenum cofactor synthesis domain-containing protein [Acetitomaculum ruminis DSM 5522]